MSTARVLRLAALVLGLVPAAFAEPVPAPKAGARAAELSLPSVSGLEFEGKPILRVDVLVEGERFAQPLSLKQLMVGQAFSPELARRALRELIEGGRFADARIEAVPAGNGVILQFHVLPRRVVMRIELSGAPLSSEELLRGDLLHVGDELTAPDLPRIERKAQAELARRGYPNAVVSARALDTDDPLNVVVQLDVKGGAPWSVKERWFGVWPDPDAPGMRAALAGYDVGPGDRADVEAIDAADKELEASLRARGWHRAHVTHRLEPRPSGALLRVEVQAGPLLRLQFEGNRAFDADALTDALELEESEDRDPGVLVDRLRDYYEKRGFYDADIRVEERGDKDAPVHVLAFLIRERQPVRVIRREYACLTERPPAAIASEIDSFLSELPGSDFLGPVDDNVVSSVYGPGTEGRRKAPLAESPWSYYVPEAYDKAIDHLKDLFRSQGYLAASVGPITLLRRACDPRSQPGACIPVGPRKRPPTTCRYDAIGLPLEEPTPDPALTCHPDPRRGLSCEPDAVVYLPIKLGPRTSLYEVAFEGNKLVVESELADIAALEIGKPVSQVELENARRRIADAYAERGFAFAEVEVTLDLSSDHQHGRARFIISERQPVRISRIEVRGAHTTREGLIRERIALKIGGLYRRSLARRTEELLGQLGVFSNVTVGFEDPYVPAREKVVIVRVEERKRQRVDVAPGLSTGDGVRFLFQYGYMNIGGEGIHLTIASQLGYLPDAFILEPDVRRKYDELIVRDRLERRNSITLQFPGIGLGPLFPAELSGIDVRDNSRDYGVTKDAAIATLYYRPSRKLAFQIGGSLERNVASIFGTDQKGALDEYVKAHPEQRNTFRVPEGTTFVTAQRARASWDRRDKPLDATTGTLVTLGAEHVHATPTGDSANQPFDPNASVFQATTSDFMRYDARIAGYIRLSERGLALALSLRGGVIQQLISESRTYPDRLFFLGGADTIRGFAQDSVVPEDIARQLLVPNTGVTGGLTIDDVVIRGGDIFINPRAELRIPITTNVQTALFVDAGNLWTSPSQIAPFRLRYTTGSGLRIGTPIGPLVFDYGFNVDRVLDKLFPSRKDQRYWESLGAFHFSIGVL
jgi:outer membrane protein assembly factor BamA